MIKLKYLKVTDFTKLSEIEKIKVLKKIALGQIRIKDDRRR